MFLIFFLRTTKRDKLEPRIVEELSDYYSTLTDQSMTKLINEVLHNTIHEFYIMYCLLHYILQLYCV